MIVFVMVFLLQVTTLSNIMVRYYSGLPFFNVVNLYIGSLADLRKDYARGDFFRSSKERKKNCVLM